MKPKKPTDWVNVRIRRKAHDILKARAKKEYKTIVGLISEWLGV